VAVHAPHPRMHALLMERLLLLHVLLVVGRYHYQLGVALMLGRVSHHGGGTRRGGCPTPLPARVRGRGVHIVLGRHALNLLGRGSPRGWVHR
jgi:hypothetical protein